MKQTIHYNKKKKSTQLETDFESEFCPHCGNRTSRWESLSKGLIRNLITFSYAIKEKKRNSIHLQKELDLTKNQYNNFQKLGYFGLVEKEPFKTGFWKITEKGVQFILGRIRIPKKVKVRKRKAVDYSEEEIYINDEISDLPYWLKKEDYV